MSPYSTKKYAGDVSMNMENNNGSGVFGRLKEGLSKTRKGFIRNIDEMIFGEKVISRDSF